VGWRLNKLFNFKSKPFKVEEGHVITPAFKSGGVQYYRMTDIFNTYAFRALDALAVYEQWQMRCTPEYLVAHKEAMKKLLSDPHKIDITSIVKLYNNLEERLAFAIPTEDIIWNFAAVVYFDENENPYKYDPEYGKQKIARWKKDKKAVDFFFIQPIKELIPSPELSGEGLDTYLKMANKISQEQLKQVLDILSPEGQNKDFYQALLYQKSLQQTLAV